MAIINTNPKSFIKALRGSIKSAIPVTLTSVVREAKKTAPDQISKDMTLRARGFISRSIRYKKASRAKPMASYGMISRDRFTGLEAQEKGETKTKRVPTLKGSRGGTIKRRVAPRFRLKPGIKLKSKKSFSKKPKNNKELLAHLRGLRYKGMFGLEKENKQRKGIYRLSGFSKKSKLVLIHAIGDIPKQRKRPWMKHTNERIIKSNTGQKTWKSTMSRFMSDRIRRY